MAYLVHSNNVFKQTELLQLDGGSFHCAPIKGNIGSLPTLFTQDGKFNHEANSYLFYLKAIKQAKDLSPCAQALNAYYQFLDDEQISWDYFPPVKRLKPTYRFCSHLRKQIKNGEIAHSTASIRMNQVINFYKWLLYEGYLKIKNEKEAPFVVEYTSIQTTGMLAHISPSFIVQTTDLRIKVPKDASTNNIRPLMPLSKEFLDILTSYLPRASEELRMQVLISIDTGLRIGEVATLSLDALDTATPLAESEHRYELCISPQLNGVQTKYGKARRIEISAQLLSVLNEYRTSERRLRRASKLNIKLENLAELTLTLRQETIEALELSVRHEPLFISEQGNPISGKSIEARWTDLRTMIKKIYPAFNHRFHDLRSSYGTYRLNDLLDANLPVVDCMELLMGWMGHRHEATTWKYLRFLNRKETFKVKFGILDSIMHEALGGDNE